MRYLALFLLAFAAYAQTDSNTTTSSGKAYSYCKHTLTTERLLKVEVCYMDGNIERRCRTLRDEKGTVVVNEMVPKTYVVEMTPLTAPLRPSGIRMTCTFQQPSPALKPTTSQETQPWVEPLPEQPVGTVMKMAVAVQEPSPGLRQVVIGGFR